MSPELHDFWIYRGKGTPAVAPPAAPYLLPVLQRDKLNNPALYEAGADLADAVNVALHLDRPLLLTGEAGTGKTGLASSIAWELGYPFEKFETKSTSTATDLFYTYNALAQFHRAQLEAQASASNRILEPPERLGLWFLQYNALGKAILRANSREVVNRFLPTGFDHPGKPIRTVVLIDEVDKAPRDLPNDVLSALDDMAFTIPELGSVRIEAAADFRPIIVFTSNSEKALPDPFLRRCIYYNIPFPEPERLAQIVTKRLGSQVEQGGLLDDALKLLDLIRQAPGLRKKPATAELLDWVGVLARLRGSEGVNPLRRLRDPSDPAAETILRSLAGLVKNEEDFNPAKLDDNRPVNKVLRQWISGK